MSESWGWSCGGSPSAATFPSTVCIEVPRKPRRTQPFHFNHQQNAMAKTKEKPPPPPGYRILKKGEYTKSGDLGFLNGKWGVLRAGHVVHQEIVHDKGNVARNEEEESSTKGTTHTMDIIEVRVTFSSGNGEHDIVVDSEGRVDLEADLRDYPAKRDYGKIKQLKEVVSCLIKDPQFNETVAVS